MNSFTSNPTAAQAVARHTIEQRVRDAEERRVARGIREQRRAAARAARVYRHEPVSTLPWWAFRFLRPAH
jgi:hypothetical protein